jgi:hypothetical protein
LRARAERAEEARDCAAQDRYFRDSVGLCRQCPADLPQDCASGLAIADRVIFVSRASHAEAYRAEVGDRLCPFRQHAATRFLAQDAEPGEIILIKASGSDHLERIASSHFGDIVCWRERCGKARPWPNCLHYRTPSAPPAAEFLVEQDERRAQDLSDIDEEIRAAS